MNQDDGTALANILKCDPVAIDIGVIEAGHSRLLSFELLFEARADRGGRPTGCLKQRPSVEQHVSGYVGLSIDWASFLIGANCPVLTIQGWNGGNLPVRRYQVPRLSIRHLSEDRGWQPFRR